MKHTIIVLNLFFLITNSTLQAESHLLAPVKTDSPRVTMRSFMDAMNDYKIGKSTGNTVLQSRINDALETLDLASFPPVLREDKGREAAIFLKEVLDRLLVVDYSKIPNDSALSKWRIANTRLTIVKIETGENKGEYLFSTTTVLNARNYYNKVKSNPYLKGSGDGALYEPPMIEQVAPGWSKVKDLGMYRWQWLGLLLAFLVGLTGKFFSEKLMQRIKIYVHRSRGKWDDRILHAIEPPMGLISASLIWFVALKVLQIEGDLLNILTMIVQITFSLACVWLAYRVAGVTTDIVRYFSRKKTFLLNSTLEPLFLGALKGFIVVLGVLISMQNLGINVMSLLAGLGLGGLAFALAAKDTAANVFGSIMILWDKPFAVGDWIIADGVEGTVEEIGFRSTRIRTFYKSQITVPNQQMAVANIDNMGRRPCRRIKVTFGLTYDTPVEKIESFVEGVKNIVKANGFTDKENFHVCFNSYGDSSLNILLYCFLIVPDWATELVERQNIFLEVKRLATAIGVDFAFPTQTLHLDSTPDKAVERQDLFAGDKVNELKNVSREFGPKGARARPDGLGFFTPLYKE